MRSPATEAATHRLSAWPTPAFAQYAKQARRLLYRCDSEEAAHSYPPLPAADALRCVCCLQMQMGKSYVRYGSPLARSGSIACCHGCRRRRLVSSVVVIVVVKSSRVCVYQLLRTCDSSRKCVASRPARRASHVL